MRICILYIYKKSASYLKEFNAEINSTLVKRLNFSFNFLISDIQISIKPNILQNGLVVGHDGNVLKSRYISDYYYYTKNAIQIFLQQILDIYVWLLYILYMVGSDDYNQTVLDDIGYRQMNCFYFQQLQYICSFIEIVQQKQQYIYIASLKLKCYFEVN